MSDSASHAGSSMVPTALHAVVAQVPSGCLPHLAGGAGSGAADARAVSCTCMNDRRAPGSLSLAAGAICRSWSPAGAAIQCPTFSREKIATTRMETEQAFVHEGVWTESAMCGGCVLEAACLKERNRFCG